MGNSDEGVEQKFLPALFDVGHRRAGQINAPREGFLTDSLVLPCRPDATANIPIKSQRKGAFRFIWCCVSNHA
jgi:hypothetical protein